MKNVVKYEKKYICQTAKRQPLVIAKSDGKYLWDANGKKYLDFFSGVSVCNVGHSNKKVVNAIISQSKKLIHVSNHYYTKSQTDLACMVIKNTIPGKVFFSNSGTEANETAIKMARKWGAKKGKFEIITFFNSFHGRTYGSLSATAQKASHKGFEPILKGFKYAKLNDLGSVKKLINKNTVAVMIEPVQGEGGDYPCDKNFLKFLKALCEKNNILLIFDEIQTGMGRTGTLFAFQGYGVKPDIITIAKSIAGGLPLGVTVAGKKVSNTLIPGDHGSTFGGNPVSCSAALEVFNILKPSFLKKVQENAFYFLNKLLDLKDKYAFIKEVRGLGMMLGLELAFEGASIVQLCLKKGLIVNCTHKNVVRFLPPLIVGKKDIDKACFILDSVFMSIKA